MADSRFFHNNGPISLEKIIDLTGAVLQNPADKNSLIEDVAPLESASPTQLSFLINSKYLPAFKNSKAGFCFVAEKFANHAPSSMVVLLHSNPYKAYALVASNFYIEKKMKAMISPNAVISNTAKIGNNCFIGNFVVIEDGVSIGDNSIIDHNTVIKRNVVIGNDAKIASNVTISHSIIGDNVIIHPGTKIGQDGFGFASDHTVLA